MSVSRAGLGLLGAAASTQFPCRRQAWPQMVVNATEHAEHGRDVLITSTTKNVICQMCYCHPPLQAWKEKEANTSFPNDRVNPPIQAIRRQTAANRLISRRTGSVES